MGALVVAVTAVVGVPVAGAGTYDVVACNAPGAHGVNNSWSWTVWTLNGAPTPDDSAAYALGGDCASSTGMRTGPTTTPRTIRWGTYANFNFTAPADTDIVRVALWRHGYAKLGTDDPGTPDNESGRWEVNAQFGANQVFADTCHPGSGVWPDPCQTGSPGFSAASKIVHDGRADTFSIGVFCGGDNGPFIACTTSDPNGVQRGYLDLQGAVVTLEDNSRPRITATGSMLSGGWRRPSDAVTVNTTDNSGIRVVQLEAGGRVITSRIQPCDGTRPIPCRSTVNGLRFTGAGIPDGTQTLRLVSLDAARNAAAVQETLLIDGTPPTAILERARGRKIVLSVRDAASGVASAGIEIRNRSTEPYRALKSTLKGGKLRATLDAGNAGKTDMRVTVRDKAGNRTQGNPTRLSATSAKVGRRFRRVRSGRVKVPFGRSATLRGRLALSAGQPFAGQTVTATSTVRRRGADAQPAGSAVTDRRGRFAIKVPAGPSRNYRLVFAGAGTGLGAARGVSVRVPASSTIRASRKRLSGPARVRFSGHLRSRGQRIPGRGLLLVLQGREGGQWRTFEDTRTNRKGRWHVSYGFSGRPGRYPIRVRIRRQSGYPFELGYSRRLTIRVG